MADLEGLGPLVRDKDVAVVGRRDAEEASKAGSQRIEDTLINVIDLPAVRRLGVQRAAGLALDVFEEPDLAGF